VRPGEVNPLGSPKALKAKNDEIRMPNDELMSKPEYRKSNSKVLGDLHIRHSFVI
jgi:hypothetical protein